MSSDAPVKINGVPSLESTIRRAAAVSVVCSELVTLMDLWAMTGYDRAQRPDADFFRAAIWDAVAVLHAQGEKVLSVPPTGVWSDETVADAARCGVDVFA